MNKDTRQTVLSVAMTSLGIAVLDRSAVCV